MAILEGQLVCLLLCAVTLLLSLVQWLILRSKIEGVEASKAGLAQEIIALKREAARLNTPSTYAKCAKAQRQANAKEKELAALSNAKKTWADHVALGCAWGKMGVAVAAGVALWKQPVAQVPLGMAWPFERLLAMPHGSDFKAYGYIAAAPWVLLCGKAGDALARAVFTQRSAEVLLSKRKAGSVTTPAVMSTSSSTGDMTGPVVVQQTDSKKDA